MPIHYHCTYSIQPAPQAFYETCQIEFVFKQYALKNINKFKIILIVMMIVLCFFILCFRKYVHQNENYMTSIINLEQTLTEQAYK